MNFEFMTIDTPLPPCMPFPRALTGFQLAAPQRYVLPDVGRYALQRAGGRERNPVCLLPCYSHCRSPVPQPHDGQAFFE